MVQELVLNQDERDERMSQELVLNQDALRRRSGDGIGGWTKIIMHNVSDIWFPCRVLELSTLYLKWFSSLEMSRGLKDFLRK
ncbi:hypothetical protein [Sphingobacterium mizutaii]|uniref:hypothetical protein n=1 Tax=Sphingobacterium mizutaii TaxID=1010 RepID=UPI0028ACC580|nr:hypothetical protein [Sphingobacterium mizutaii]